MKTRAVIVVKNLFNSKGRETKKLYVYFQDIIVDMVKNYIFFGGLMDYFL